MPWEAAVRITTKQIAAFVTVADQQNYSRAARMLNVTQPSLSVLVRDLEATLGVRLFDRTTRGVRLSKVGNQLLPIAERIRDDIELMLSASSGLSDLTQGRVRIACSMVMAISQLIPIASRFEARFPNIRIEIVDTVEQALADLVRTEAVDFAVATEVDPEPRIVQTRIGEDRLAVYFPADHPFADREQVTWAELRSERLALLNKGSPLRQVVDRTAGRMGLRLNMTYEVSFGATALALVERGLAVTILPANALQADTAYTCQRRLLVKPSIPRRVVIMLLAGRSPSPAAAEFERFCTSEFSTNFQQAANSL